MRRLTTVYEVPPIMILSISLNTLRLDEEIVFGPTKTLKLHGLINHSQIAAHFTSVVVDSRGVMWYHDGMTTGRSCMYNGRFLDKQDRLTLHQKGNEQLYTTIYAMK
jgi:hypothetical protein